uniref:Cystatin domain-containing protein n=1 Tax=Globisporangium ultimum (strain ATCC 200006 / CBS 805.95 / DAOM BR144) TaxID=431595 RepID=K3X3Q5_GLOUD
MVICFKPSSLFVTAAALALFVSASSINTVAAQDASGDVQVINFEDDIAGAVTPSDAIGNEATADEGLTADLTTTTDDSVGADNASADGAANTASSDNVDGDAVTILGGQTTFGAWKDEDLTDSVVSTIVDALSNATNYSPTIIKPICALQINSAQSQLVSGTNYKYEVEGCAINFNDELGACRNRDCAKAVYEVVVYSQTWTDTLQVSSITLVE